VTQLYIKSGFAFLLLVLYVMAAATMVNGALNTSGYLPNSGTTWLAISVGGGLIASVAAQLGVALGTETNGGGGGLDRRLSARHFGGADAADADSRKRMAVRVNVGVLVLSVLALVGFGFVFVYLWVDPGSIDVADGAARLKDAPEYIETQAKAFVGLVLAGAGVGVAANR
jgi:hypothetical protein